LKNESVNAKQKTSTLSKLQDPGLAANDLT
jgi:hypothetical protein